MMRALIFGGEYPAHLQHVQTVLDACDSQGVEYVFYLGKNEPRPGTFAPRNPFLHRLRDFFWDRFKWTPNRFKKDDFEWRGYDDNGTYSCKAIKGSLPWKPDVVIVVTPHEGHARYQLIPWANKEGIPVLSIDHGMPTVAWKWGSYRGSMMGCTANAVWSEICQEVNSEFGAPTEMQVITGSPSIDKLRDVKNRSDFCQEFDLDVSRKLVLMLGTHRSEVKVPNDLVFQEIIDTYSTDVNYQLIYKPHPVECAKGEMLDIPEQVRLFTSQKEYLSLVNCVDVVVSPASSVVVPSMAFEKAFVNTITMENNGASRESLARLQEALGSAVFRPEKLHEVITGALQVDVGGCKLAFERFGYKSDGNNGSRVLSLAMHLADGGAPSEWVDGV